MKLTKSAIRNHILILLIMIPIINSCIDQINLNVSSVEEKLVIEGLMTNEDKPYQVKISRTTPITEKPIDQVSLVEVTGAIVTVTDDLGQEIELREIESGTYQTVDPNFKGEIGRAYILTVIIDGQKYTSTSELMEPVLAVQNIYKDFSKEDYFNENNIELTNFYLNVYFDFENSTTKNSNILLDWKYVYEFETFPQDNMKPPWFNVPDPYPCSGYIYNGEELIQVGPCECCDCWGTDFSPFEKVINIEGKTSANSVKVASIYIDPFEVREKMQVKVTLQSLTDQAYTFWKTIEEQRNNTGSLFDVPQGKIKGNITNVTDPQEEVLGYFGASAIIEKSIFVLPQELRIGIDLFDSVLTIPCTDWIAPNISNIKPSDWQ